MNSEPNQNIENLLNELKSEYQASNKAPLSPNSQNEIEDLFDEVKSELKSDQNAKTNLNSVNSNQSQAVVDVNRTNITQNRSQINEFDFLKEQYKQKQARFLTERDTNKIGSNSSQVNESLNSIKAEYQNKPTQDDSIYQKNKQEIILQEQQQQLQRKQLVQQAEKWLANLDPLSEEGIWFNELADSYSSRLEAAIDYLSTIDKSNF